MEAGKKRKGAQLARDIEISLPRELSQPEAIRLAQDFVREQFVAPGMVVNLNVHRTPAGDAELQSQTLGGCARPPPLRHPGRLLQPAYQPALQGADRGLCGHRRGRERASGERLLGFLQDSTLVAAAVQEPRSRDDHSPLPVEDEVGWNMAVPKTDRDGPLDQFIDNVLVDWHRSGWLIELERKWKLTPPSPLLKRLHEKYQAK